MSATSVPTCPDVLSYLQRYLAAFHGVLDPHQERRKGTARPRFSVSV